MKLIFFQYGDDVGIKGSSPEKWVWKPDNRVFQTFFGFVFSLDFLFYVHVPCIDEKLQSNDKVKVV